MKDKIILITGGSSGIGLEMAKQMADMGNSVIICGRSEQRLERAGRDNPELVTIRCDITDEKDRKALHETILNDFGRLDMLVNNAGIGNIILLAESSNTEKTVTEEWQTNYLAPLLLSQMFMELVAARRGSIVNVSSGLAFVPQFVRPNYSATKAALHSMTLSMRIQFEKSGIKVVEIFYPAVDTPFQKGQSPKHAIKPDEAARIALKGILKGEDEIYVKKAALIYRLNRLMPKRALKIISGLAPEKPAGQPQ
jgi:uncharacterized oxidoreductase